MGSTKVSYPQQPQAPSTVQNINDYNQWLENQYQMGLKYAPLEAQQQIELAQRYALPYGEAMKAAQEAMYPGTTAIQEKLAGQAITGMQSGMPEDIRQQYLSDVRANLGTNVGSPIGATEVARGLAQMNEDWKRYYQNLGLSVTNRQPLTQSQTPGWTNQMAQISPSAVMNQNQGIYGTQAGMWNTKAQGAIQQAQYNSPYAYMQAGGNVLQGISSMGNPMSWFK